MSEVNKPKSTNVTVSLPDFHAKKLKAMRNKLGVGNSGIIQRLIENQSIFTLGTQKGTETE